MKKKKKKKNLVAEEGGLIIEAASERLDSALTFDGAQRAHHAHPLRQRLRLVQQPFLLPAHPCPSERLRGRPT